MMFRERQYRIKELEVQFENVKEEFLMAKTSDERQTLIEESQSILAEFRELVAQVSALTRRLNLDRIP